MKRYEYIFLASSDHEKLMLLVNDCGRDGWRVAGFSAYVTDVGHQFTTILEREIA
jgi:hypothetical protein